MIFLNADSGELLDERKKFKDLTSSADEDKVKFIFSSKTSSYLYDTVINEHGEIIESKKHFFGKTIALYFSSNSCEFSKILTPTLADYYKKYNETKKFEIVFVSRDNDENQFKAYFQQMPWLALSFSEKKTEVIFYCK